MRDLENEIESLRKVVFFFWQGSIVFHFWSIGKGFCIFSLLAAFFFPSVLSCFGCLVFVISIYIYIFLDLSAFCTVIKKLINLYDMRFF